MSEKPDLASQTTPIAALETGSTTVSGLFDFGAAATRRKPLFQFAKRKGAAPLGPTRSEYGCD